MAIINVALDVMNTLDLALELRDLAMPLLTFKLTRFVLARVTN